MEEGLEATGDIFGVLDSGQQTLQEFVVKAFKAHDIPCINDISKLLYSTKTANFGRRMQFLETLKARTASTEMSLGEIFSCRQDYFHEIYENKNVVFQIGESTTVGDKELSQTIISKFALYKKYNPSEFLSHVLFFDEAQSGIWSKNLANPKRISSVGKIATQCRSQGLGLFVSTQNVRNLIPETVTNCSTYFCFTTGGTEIPLLRELLGLTRNQAEFLHHMPEGLAIMKSTIGFTKPMLIQINPVLPEKVTDTELEVLMKDQWDYLLSKVTPVIIENPKPENIEEEQPEKIEEPNSDKPDKDEKLFLNDVYYRPYELIAKRYKKIRLPETRAANVKERLCRKGYLEEVKIRLPKKGKSPALLRFTDKAMKYLDIEFAAGKGSNEHNWWEHYIREVARKLNLKSKIEDMGADVSISTEHGDIAIEVSISTSNIKENIDRNLNNGYMQIWIAVPDEKRLKIANEVISTDYFTNNNVKAILLNDIVLELMKLKD